MPDSMVTPPLQGGNPPPNLVLGGQQGGGGKPPLSKNAKIGLGVGGFAFIAIAAYLYSEHKAATASTTASTANTAPEVIAPSTDQDQLPASGNSLGSGGGTFSGKGNLATELAQIQSELLALQTAQGQAIGPSPNNPVSPALVAPDGSTLPAPAPGTNYTEDINNANANQQFVSEVGQQASELYQAYLATLPAGGLAPGQSLNSQQQAALTAYNQAAASYGNTA